MASVGDCKTMMSSDGMQAVMASTPNDDLSDASSIDEDVVGSSLDMKLDPNEFNEVEEEIRQSASDSTSEEDEFERSSAASPTTDEFPVQSKTDCSEKEDEKVQAFTNTSLPDTRVSKSTKKVAPDEYTKRTKTKDLTRDNGYIEEDITMPSVEVINCPKGIMRDLAEPYFDVWRLDRDSMIDHIEYMYHDLGVVRAWKIPRSTLRMFLLGVRERYQDNPYHNFKHCFCVTQMAYSIICKLRLRNKVSVDHLGALLTAAVCHDVDHPGLNNSYHCHARTPLAILYNYKSILEQHHFAVACRILSNKERNIFRNVNNRDEVLTNVGDLILATDLARHKEIMDTYRCNIDTGFDFKNSTHVLSLLKIIIKCADVSNEVRPETVASPWVDRLFAEYSEQSAREKRERLPVTSYMDPDVVNVPQSQEGFIRGIMLPMYDEMCRLASDARAYFISPLHDALLRYEIQSLRERGV